MTHDEFRDWIARHEARFQNVRTHLGKLVPSKRGEVLRVWEDLLADVPLDAATEASDELKRRGKVVYFDDHPGQIKAIAKTHRVRGYAVAGVHCVTCRSTGFVSILILVTADGRKTLDGFRIVDYWRTVVATEQDDNKRRVAENRIHETTVRCICERGQSKNFNGGSITFEPKNHITCWEPKTVRRDPAWWDAVEQEVCQMQESGFDAAPGYETQPLGAWS